MYLRQLKNWLDCDSDATSDDDADRDGGKEVDFAQRGQVRARVKSLDAQFGNCAEYSHVSCDDDWGQTPNTRAVENDSPVADTAEVFVVMRPDQKPSFHDDW